MGEILNWGSCQIEVPEEYCFEEENDQLSIFKVDGVGAITISSYHIPPAYNFLIKDELLNFIQSIEKSIEFEECISEAYENGKCSCEFLDVKNQFWRVWVLFSKNNSIFISYNCESLEKEVERGIVSQIVRSVVLI